MLGLLPRRSSAVPFRLALCAVPCRALARVLLAVLPCPLCLQCDYTVPLYTVAHVDRRSAHTMVTDGIIVSSSKEALPHCDRLHIGPLSLRSYTLVKWPYSSAHQRYPLL